MADQTETTSIPEMVDEVRAGKLPRRRFMKILTTMGISAAGVGVISAATTCSLPFIQQPVVHARAVEAENLHLHKQHLAHQSQGNIDALHHDYAEHAIVEDSMHPQPFVGRAAIIARKNSGMSTFPDVQITPTNRVAHGNQVTVEWVATGVHSGDLPGLPATGRAFSIHGVTVVVRENGKIVRESIYYNVGEFYRQVSSAS